MKRILKLTAVAFVLVLGSSLRNTVSAQYDYGNDRDVSYQTFYDELSPHGQWIDYPDYGYVWVPDAGDDFRPYSSNGHWVWTDNYEWMWVSDYEWGWAPFHYGRWEEDDYYGWFWVPGYEWSPAWVAWRDGGDYYGWAPIRPGININVNFNIGGYAPPDNYWCFAPRRYITSPRLFDYCVDRRRNVTIIHQTTIIVNNYNYGGGYGFRAGPRRYDAERYCGRINPVRLRDSYNPGRTTFRNNEVNIYRPQVRRDDNRTFAPRQFNRYDRQDGNNRGASNNNGFRRGNDNNNGNNNGIRRTDDNRGNDNRFRRTDDNRRNNEVNNGNNDRRERSGNGPFRRTDDNVREPQTRSRDNNLERRRMERPENGNDQPNRRVFQPGERREGPAPGGPTDSRRLERRTDNGGNNTIRQPQRQPAQQMERRQEPRQQRPQMERRTEQRQPAQQMERRQEPRPQQQPRQFERRNDGGGSQPSRSNESRGGNNSGRSRRF
ncbi:MAG: hypothetical protein JNM19_04715 [Chitinophagaceae bacterium]|nr:hypothetical protein [Chitinophagaceae bacterium]